MKQTVYTAGAAIVVIFCAAALADLFPQIGELHRRIEEHRRVLIAIAATGSGIGLVLFFGAVLSLIMDRGAPVGQHDVENQMRSQRQAFAWPYVFRASSYRVRGQAVGVEAHDQFTVSELKAAFRRGELLSDARWRRRMAVSIGALLMLFGILGLAFVFSPPAAKIVIGVAALYALVRITWGFARA